MQRAQPLPTLMSSPLCQPPPPQSHLSPPAAAARRVVASPRPAQSLSSLHSPPVLSPAHRTKRLSPQPMLQPPLPPPLPLLPPLPSPSTPPPHMRPQQQPPPASPCTPSRSRGRRSSQSPLRQKRSASSLSADLAAAAIPSASPPRMSPHDARLIVSPKHIVVKFSLAPQPQLLQEGPPLQRQKTEDGARVFARQQRKKEAKLQQPQPVALLPPLPKELIPLQLLVVRWLSGGFPAEELILLREILANVEQTKRQHVPLVPLGLPAILATLKAKIDPERVLTCPPEELAICLEGAHLALHIMTSADVPKDVLIDEVIKNILVVVKTLALEVIFAGKAPQTTGKPSRRKGYAALSATAVVLKIGAVLSLFHELARSLTMADDLIIAATDTCVASIFVSPSAVGIITDLHPIAIEFLRTTFLRYPQHRTEILRTLIIEFAKGTGKATTSRSFRLHNSVQSIHLFTAVVLQLVQCCCGLPGVPTPLAQVGGTTSSGVDLAPPPDDTSDDDGDEGGDVGDLYCQKAALGCIKFFWRTLLAQAGKKEEGHTRTVAEGVVADLLHTLFLPDWPAAEHFLHALILLLVHNLSSGESALGFKQSSLELLGAIGAKLKTEGRYLAKFRDSQVKDTGDQPACCRKEAPEMALVQCASCYKLYHADCVGSDQSSPVPEWHCTECSLRSYVDDELRKGFQLPRRRDSLTLDEKYSEGESEDEKSSQSSDNESDDGSSYHRQVAKSKKHSKKEKTKTKKGGDDDATDNVPREELQFSEEDYCRQQVLLYIRLNQQVNPLLRYARQFYLSQWYEEDPLVADGDTAPAKAHKARLALFKRLWLCFPEDKDLPCDSASFVKIPEDRVKDVLRYLAAQRALLKGADNVLYRVLFSLSSPKITIRARAMKALTTIVEADPDTLGDAHVREAVKYRLLDTAKSVRKNTVDLIGAHILHNPKLTNDYYPMLLKHVKDIGLSVRKRVVKVCHDVCIRRESSSECVVTICRELVHRLNDEPSIQEMVMKTFKELWFSLDNTTAVAVRTEQILEVAQSFDSREWFVKLVQQILEESKDAVLPICDGICKCIMDRVVKSNLKDAVGPLSCLHMFALARPLLTRDHVATLHPYLQSTAASDNEALGHIIAVIELALPTITIPDRQLVAELETDLVSLLKMKAPAVLPVCAKCLCTIVSVISHNDALLNAQFIFFATLLCEMGPTVNALERSVNHRIQRSLFALGLLCKHHDFAATGLVAAAEADEASRPPAVVTRKVDLRKGKLAASLFDHIVRWTENPEAEICAKAWQTVAAMLVQWSDLTYQSSFAKRFATALRSPVARIREVVLSVFYELLSQERDQAAHEKQTPQPSETPRKIEQGKFKSAYRASSAGCNLVSQHAHQLFEMLLDPVAAVRQACLKTITLVAVGGIVNLFECVKYLIALEADKDTELADQAHNVICKIHKNFPDFILQQFLDGLHTALTFQKKASKPAVFRYNGETKTIRSLFGRIYCLLAPSGRLMCIQMLFSPCQASTDDLEVDYARYLLEVVAFLPLSGMDEMAAVLQQINRMLMLKAGGVVLLLKEELKRRASATSATNREVPQLWLTSTKNRDYVSGGFYF
eukprot:TRINITY_DN1643_c0_g1_i1.p1 TRINITY_DN1643_c0_g1~~TRINITY_DN1643_c0_g1_i1.p1  ORF type:complete len:1737 (-),score=481.30 TRINITY_DN1643_c0_g1_i1:787-5571(-)